MMIINESSLFKFKAAENFNEETKKQNIDYLLKNCPEL
jgi:hypothetical protein